MIIPSIHPLMRLYGEGSDNRFMGIGGGNPGLYGMMNRDPANITLTYSLTRPEVGRV